ncbi:AbrB/MazE/SpoVT family DNA-binding domain-containing protein [Peribacillus frigoritolerans]|uniref:AbrB/MazE/SpoVT family DNA-binding domain-containing protein n=1 Tax=Peribacillus frigoritolerans TaxID=450367 RepID=UPI0037CC6DCD
MKSIGVVRKVDELGRIVMPIELRRTLEIEIKDAMEFFVDGDKIILKKYRANMACAITGEVTNQNKTYANGNLVLSPKGAELLLGEMESNK